MVRVRWKSDVGVFACPLTDTSDRCTRRGNDAPLRQCFFFALGVVDALCLPADFEAGALLVDLADEDLLADFDWADDLPADFAVALPVERVAPFFAVLLLVPGFFTDVLPCGARIADALAVPGDTMLDVGRAGCTGSFQLNANICAPT